MAMPLFIVAPFGRPFPAFYILFRDERNYSTENGLRATGLVGVVSVVMRDMFRERRSRDGFSHDAQWRVACGVRREQFTASV